MLSLLPRGGLRQEILQCPHLGQIVDDRVEHDSTAIGMDVKVTNSVHRNPDAHRLASSDRDSPGGSDAGLYEEQVALVA
jgi:hypothetical protein